MADGRGQENGQRGRADDGRGRSYPGFGDERWPSVTTLTGLVPGKAEGLSAWRRAVGDEAADARLAEAIERGNRVHDAIEAYGRAKLAGKAVTDLGDCPTSVADWLDSYVKTVVAQELTLGNSVEQYAGTADLIGVLLDGTPFGLDWKTGKRRPEHAIQVVAYIDCDLEYDAEVGEAPTWRPLREVDGWAPDEGWTPAVAALVGYIDADGELDVWQVPASAYDRLRAVRRGLRASWDWYEARKGVLKRWSA